VTSATRGARRHIEEMQSKLRKTTEVELEAAKLRLILRCARISVGFGFSRVSVGCVQF
jgi:hypothetical protein